jgi:hypothetical protein
MKRGVKCPDDLALLTAKYSECVSLLDDGDKWNEDNWVPVFFAFNTKCMTALHYYSKSELLHPSLPDIQDKTIKIAQSTGSVWAFAVTPDEKLLRPLIFINNAVQIFRDFYCAGKSGVNMCACGSIGDKIPKTPDLKSTFAVNAKDNPEILFPKKCTSLYFKENFQYLANLIHEDNVIKLSQFLAFQMDYTERTKFNSYINSIGITSDKEMAALLKKWKTEPVRPSCPHPIRKHDEPSFER